jgi:hypothetical protein
MPLRRVLLGLGLMAFVGGAAMPPAGQSSLHTATRPSVTATGIERPASVLFIGNSFFYFNNGLHSYLRALVRAADPGYSLRATAVTISGSGASWHDVESYFRPDAIGQFSISSEKTVVFNQFDRLFDLAVLTDCSQCPVHPKLAPIFFEHMRKQSATARQHGTVPVLFMSWAYADKPEMTAALAEAYTRAGNENEALVIPAGLAFARSVQQRPWLNLYADDKRHPSVAGTYLAACTIYAALLQKSPVGLSSRATLDRQTARFLQTVAWETVQEYYGAAKAEMAKRPE